MAKLQKGQITTLNVTQEAQHRVVVGLGWDPNENTGLVDKAKALSKRQSTHHDLDLSCYVFDVNGHYISHICAISDKHTDQTGKIYHSGDNTEGVGDGDDEQISVELKDIDPAIHSIIFVASIKSGHVFGEINAPEIRIADGYSKHNFLHHDLSDRDGEKHKSFAFIRLLKTPDNTWKLHYISEYIEPLVDGQQAANLKKYLTA